MRLETLLAQRVPVLALSLVAAVSCTHRYPAPPAMPEPVASPAASPAQNRPPTVRAQCDPCTLEVGRSLTVSADAQDPDGDLLTYRWTTPTGTLTNPTGRVTVWTAPMQQGAVPITITVSDGKGGDASGTVTVQVIRPPATAAPVDSPAPTFPWPPPQWTSRYAVPMSVVRKSVGETNEEVLVRITDALRGGQFPEWSVYGVGADGFVVVAEMETIDSRGRPLPGTARWLSDPPPLTLGFFEIIARLSTADRERYRVIAIAVTSLSLVAGPRCFSLKRCRVSLDPARERCRQRSRARPSRQKRVAMHSSTSSNVWRDNAPTGSTTRPAGSRRVRIY